MLVKLIPAALLAAFLSACAPLTEKPPAPPMKGPAEKPVAHADKLDGELPDDDLELDPPGVSIDEELEIALREPRTETGKPKLYGEELDDVSGRFRAATWNLRQLTVNTATHMIDMRLEGQTAAQEVPKGEAVFKALKAFGVHVAALQEVYKAEENAASPLPGAEGYEVIEGAKIKVNNSKGLKYEYCPIAYRPKVVSCKESSSHASTSSNTHWVECTVTNTTKSFWMGCGHIPTNPLYFENGLKRIFEELDTSVQLSQPPSTLGPQQRPMVGNSEDAQDNFILGMDANSYPHGPGFLHDKWDTWRAAWAAAHPENDDAIEIPRVGPQGAATKIYKRAGKIRVTSTASKQVIDFLMHSLKPDITYDMGSMQVLDVRLLFSHKSGQPLWRAYHLLSDHLPVKADYTVH